MANQTSSDGDMAARAFNVQKDPIEPGGALPPREPDPPAPQVAAPREAVPPYDVWATGAGEGKQSQ